MTARRHLQTTRPTPARAGTHDDTWRDSAACLGSEDVFDAAMPSSPHGPPIDADAHDLALSICAACPVRAECGAATSLNDKGWVIRGGKSPSTGTTRRRWTDLGDDELTAALAVPTQCPLCDYASNKLPWHWSKAHAPTVGKCVRGHDYNGRGRCSDCIDLTAVAHNRRRRDTA